MATYARKRSFASDKSYPHSTSEPYLYPINTILKPSIRSITRLSPVKRKRLTQSTIALGGNPYKRCRDCGMEYVPSNVEDARTHKKFHASSVGGVDVPHSLLTEARILANFCTKRPKKAQKLHNRHTTKHSGVSILQEEDIIIQIDAQNSPSMMRTAERALRVAESDLGAVPIEEAELWSKVTTMGLSQLRHRIYLYVQGTKCIGLCLAEHIRSGRKVVRPRSPSPPRKACDIINIAATHTSSEAMLGISRIWVDHEYRRLSIASRLLQTVRLNFLDSGNGTRSIERSPISKEYMAFSQPTNSGACLARHFFACDQDWLIYDEQDRLPNSSAVGSNHGCLLNSST